MKSTMDKNTDTTEDVCVHSQLKKYPAKRENRKNFIVVLTALSDSLKEFRE